MKIAVVYSGEPRSFAKVKPQHDQFFDGVKVDTYHSTWSKTPNEHVEIIRSVSSNRKNLSFVDYNIPAECITVEENVKRNIGRGRIGMGTRRTAK